MRDAPGFQYLHLHRGRVVSELVSGLADVLRGDEVEARTTFNAYSVTKTLTAWAVEHLAAAGALALDRPIGAYLPALFGRGGPTVAQLLVHRGGLPNPNPIAWCHGDESHAQFDAAAFARTTLADNLARCEPPGHRFRYSNLGYLALGLLIEAVGAQSYAQFIRSQLIAPLELGPAETLDFTIRRPATHARGTCRRLGLVDALLGFWLDRAKFIDGASGRWRQLRPMHVDGTAYGGLIANARGLARFLTARSGSGAADRAAFPGWFTGRFAGHDYVCHAGGAVGYYCEVRIYPALDRASALMTNGTGLRDRRRLDAFDRDALAGAI